ncbi:MAG: XRE family transcriptional regulator [Firmicutes bacterium]|nr:XRE family transcriptional regulator [Bacillota bacterium]
MIYTLKHFNTPLIRFSAEAGAEPDVKILWADESKKEFLPLDLEELSAKGVEHWVRHRSIPKNRAYVDTLLSAMGLSINRPFDILRVSKGLSLNDCFWVTEDGFGGSFEKFNLYDNRFSRVLGQIAFTGFGGSVSGMSSTPELTTNGMLPKCWRRENGVIWLYKGGTEGASNTGNEPYSEFYAAQIARLLEIDAIEYNLSRWKGTLCSTCKLFTSKALSFVPVGRIVRSGGMQAVRAYYQKLGAQFVKALDDMIVFDAVILNTDRHYGNFGFLVDSRSNTIVAPAPLFDHGNSLLNFVPKDALTEKNAIMKYAGAQRPCVYDDFILEARPLLTHERRNNLRKLLAFCFKRHSRYNLSKERLALLETVVREQARKLLADG